MSIAEQPSTDAPSRRTTYDSFEVQTLTPHIGAEIHGLDLSGPISPALLRDIGSAWYDWKVLVFREQVLTREQHKAFGRCFGTLHVHPMQHVYGGDPEILTVATTKDSAYTAGNGWHTDVTCEEIPPLGSMLYVTETPEGGGGDTVFADMALAYELLSEPLQAFLGGLTAVHDGGIPYVGAYKSKAPEGGYPRSRHPVVIRHPESGERILFVNPGFTSHIAGLKPAESRAILAMLYRHIDSTQQLYCRVRWEPNTLTLWDNRCTQHHSVWDYYPHSRYGERVSMLGTERPSA